MTEHRRLIDTLERLLLIEDVDLAAALERAADLLAEPLGAEKVDVLVHEPATATLAALGTNRTPMGARQRRLGLDRLPLASGGRTALVYETGTPHRGGRLDEDPGELPGLVHGLGIHSEIIVPLDVDRRRRGLLLASSSMPDAFTDEDLRFLGTVARWVGIVAHRAELARRVAEELVTILAHDLRNHLTAARGRMELVRRDAERADRPTEVALTTGAVDALDRIHRRSTTCSTSPAWNGAPSRSPRDGWSCPSWPGARRPRSPSARGRSGSRRPRR